MSGDLNPVDDATEIARRILPRGNIAARLYGTVLVTSIAATIDSDDHDAVIAMAVLVVAAAIFALTHAWARSLAERANVATHIGRGALWRSFKHEWPMVEAAGPAVLALLPAAFGVYSEDTGLWLAMALNLALLFVWGCALKRLAGGQGLWIVVSGLWTLMLGVILVILKLLVH